MNPLEYTVVNIKLGKSILYVHKEKQIYVKDHTRKKYTTYKCRNVECKCRMIKVNVDCYRMNPEVQHDHANEEKTFSERMIRVLTIRLMRKLMRKSESFSIPTALKIVNEKLGATNRHKLYTIKVNIQNDKYAESFMSIKPIESYTSN